MPVIIEGVAFYPTSDAAHYLGLSHSAVIKALTNGELTAIPVGRTFLFKQADLDAYKATERRGRGRPHGSTKKASEAK